MNFSASKTFNFFLLTTFKLAVGPSVLQTFSQSCKGDPLHLAPSFYLGECGLLLNVTKP